MTERPEASASPFPAPGRAEPLVSVILPTHDRGHLIARAIRSVMAQTHRHLELIVVDDASTDDTAGVVAAFSDPRIRYLRLPANGGVGHARNRGLDVARGTLLAFLDSDDEWLPGKLEQQVAMLVAAPAGVGVVITSHLVMHTDGRERQVHYTARDAVEFPADELLKVFRPIPSTWLLRRECLEHQRFDEALRTDEDWDLLLELTPRWGIVSLRRLLVVKHETPGALSADWRTLVDSCVVMERHRARWGHARRWMAYPHFALAQAYAQGGQFALARAPLRDAIRYRPLWWKPWALRLGLIGGGGTYRFLESVYQRYRLQP